MPVRLGAALVAEFVGTFALCCVGILAINWPEGGLLGVALAHGIILGTMVTAAMPTSGGHFNPAVTLGFLLTRKIKPVAAVAYIVIQLLAGVVAALAVYAMLGAGPPAAAVVANGTPNLMGANRAPIAASIGLLAEAIATFFLVFVVWGSAADPRARNVGGFAIGLTVAADILAFGPLTGASMNPARNFGPTLVATITEGSSALWRFHWVYWVGPILGGCLAALIYHTALWPRDPKRGFDPDALDVPETQRPTG